MEESLGGVWNERRAKKEVGRDVIWLIDPTASALSTWRDGAHL